MSNFQSCLRNDIKEAVESLALKTESLCRRLDVEKSGSHWISKLAGDYAAVRETLKAFDYVDGQHPSEAKIAPALFGVSPQTLSIVRAVNLARLSLKAALAAADPYTAELKLASGDTRKVPLTKIALKALGHARFHRRQSTRQFVVLNEKPLSVSYSWARIPKVYSLTREQALKKIDKLLATAPDDESLIEGRERLLGLLGKDDKIAEVRDPHIHPRANIRFQLSRPKQVRATMPIFYPEEDLNVAVSIRPLSAERPDKESPPSRIHRNSGRKGVIVDPIPFLRACRLHRYL